MKTSNLIIAALSAVLLAACDKPQPTSVEPTKPQPASVVRTYTEDPFTTNIVSKKTDVYVFAGTASISFDTVDYNSRYRRSFYFPSESPLLHSTYDTIHNVKLSKGEYKILIDDVFAIYEPKPWDSIQEDDTVRWYHLHDVSVFDTVGFVIVDTFFRSEFVIE